MIFFFKQKTAYEMRISDWSSDVCSSDLGSGRCRAGIAGGSCRFLSVRCGFRGAVGRCLPAGPRAELLQVEGGQFADVVDGQVRRRVEYLPGGLVRVVPLAHEDGGQAVAQHALPYWQSVG